MNDSNYDAAIRACQDCALACDRCAAACLAEDDVDRMARCIRFDLDCAAICRLTAAFMARDSAFAAETCLLCARICEACGEECASHPAAHCQACAQACVACAGICASMMGGQSA
ncbi:four-helix bundle copper-binding protein [Pigmentiphaga soli]|uniref:Four-helix bundle copper-binding protein n=1 Tax=Pigmentiphaga soli TaxID=1007095 RepID=A0ABP8HNB3_9BURK